MSSVRKLVAAPLSIVDASGAPRFGTFEGGVQSVDLHRLTGTHRPSLLKRFLTRKKWLYGFVATREVAVMFAVVDLGYSSNAFALGFDFTAGQVLADRGVLGLPAPFVDVNDAPGMGLRARFHHPTLRLAAGRGQGDAPYSGTLRLGGAPILGSPTLNLSWELSATGAAPPITVIATVEGGGVNVTQKCAGLEAAGFLESGARRYTLNGGVGGLDYTQGYLARKTAWRWALVCGRLDDGTLFGINLVEGFNESRDDVNENALWLGKELIPVGRARFTWNPQAVIEPWRVRTVDGVLDLRFKPLAVHQELRDLKMVRSQFKQPVGLWEGEIKWGGKSYTFKSAPGVAEDQSVLW
jgi:hypothetical protein